MSSRKPPSSSGDWDDFDIPTWDDSVPSSTTRKSTPTTSQRSSSRGRPPAIDPDYSDYQAPAYPPRQQPNSIPDRQPPARLSSRVPSRSTRPSQDPYRDPYSGFDDAYAGSASYPPSDYDARAPVRGDASQYDVYAAGAAVDSDWEMGTVYEEAPSQRRSRSSRQRSRPAKPSVSIARPAISDGVLAAIVGVALLGLLLMSGVVWWGIGDLNSVIPWHLNASGDVDSWISNSGLWRIPFGVFVTLAFAIVVGAYLWKRDRFAARFFVVSICIAQVLAWVAVVDQLW